MDMEQELRKASEYAKSAVVALQRALAKSGAVEAIVVLRLIGDASSLAGSIDQLAAAKHEDDAS
jgi:hypothetical protein